jgi:PAS domain S-box-containing protein
MAEPLHCDIPVQTDHAQLYELLVSELTDFVVFLMDPTGCITSWNPGVERILGYQESEWVGRSAHVIFTPEDRIAGIPEEEMTKAAHDGRAPDIRWHQRKDGSRLFVEGTMVALKDGNGQLLGFSKVMRDVTERKRAEEVVRTSEARFRALVNASSDVLYRMSPDWAEMRQLGGGGFIPDTEAPNRNWLQEYIHPDDQREVSEAIDEAIRTKSVFQLEHRVRRVDGSLGWTHSRAVPLVDANGEITEWFGAATDITIRKVTEVERAHLLQRIEDERQRLQQVFAQAPVAVAVLRGPAMVFELANHSYQEFFPGRELAGRPLLDALPEISAELVAILQGVLDTGEPFIGHEYLVPLDRDRDGVMEDTWFTFVYQPLREPDGTVSGIVAVVVDVTPHVRARQELERVNRGLEEFAHVASHDLQEPLRMVNSYSQLLVRSLGQNVTDEQREFAGFIQSGVKRMEQLIKDLLSYSRAIYTVGETAINEASLSEAISQALMGVESRIIETGATITYDPLPMVRGDTMQLAHVLQNLLSNSLKYRKPTELPRIHISVQRQKDEWVISVHDNGIGFEARQAKRIFGLFKRLHTEAEYPGTGLGLAICQRIIERYGGKMWAESEAGVGSTFFFSLPGVR